MKKKEKKIRADALIVQNGNALDLIDARKLILSGKVRIGCDHVVRNASDLLPVSTMLNIDEGNKYVSRGAFKLLPSIKKYTPCLNGKIGLDIGASTGGFTEVMLELGANKVYAVDSGTNQLHYKLRQNPKVISMEQTNARKLTSDNIHEKADILTMDVSFISVRSIIPALVPLFNNNSFGYILVKPQFELPKNLVETGGVIKSEDLRSKAVQDVKIFIKENTDWKVAEVKPSPIKGPKGNQEYILCIKIN